MKDLMMVFANILPEEKIIEELKNAIVEYEDAIDDQVKKEIRGKVSMYATLFLSKDMLTLRSEETGKDSTESLIDVLKDLDKLEKGSNFFNISEH